MQESGDRNAKAMLFAPGYSSIRAGRGTIDMSLNTNPRGCSPRVVRALRETSEISRYPHPDGLTLREQIAALHAVPACRVVLGAGADELIYTIVATFQQLGHRQLVTTEFTFPNIVHAARLVGLELIQAPYTPGKYIDCLLHAMKLSRLSRSPLFLCNPSAPFGEVIPRGTISEMVERSEVPIVVDEAAIDFCPQESSIVNCSSYPCLTVIRSFSKAYGLAGLRLGWACVPAAVADTIRLIRRPFVTSSLAQTAGMEALADHVFLEESVASLLADKELLVQRLAQLGIDVLPSATSYFVADIRCPNVERTPDAFDLCLAAGVRTVRVSDFNGLGRSSSLLRIACQLPHINQRFLDALAGVVEPRRETGPASALACDAYPSLDDVRASTAIAMVDG